MKTTLTQRLSGLIRSLALCGLALGAVSTAAAQDENKFIDPSESVAAESGSALSISLRGGFVSSYMYRGLLLYPGVSFQPSVGAFYSLGDLGTIGASLWAQVPLEEDQQTVVFFDENGNRITQDLNQKFFELDPTISYDITFDTVTVSAGHIWYTDPGYGKDEIFVNGVQQNLSERAPDTAEFYVGLALDVPLQPQFTLYYDYREIEYYYYSLGFSHTLKVPALGDDWNITPYAVFGFAGSAADDIGVYNSNGLEHINIGLATNVKWGVFALKPNFTYVFSTEEEDDLDNTRTTDKFVVGIDVAYDMGI